MRDCMAATDSQEHHQKSPSRQEPPSSRAPKESNRTTTCISTPDHSQQHHPVEEAWIWGWTENICCMPGQPQAGACIWLWGPRWQLWQPGVAAGTSSASACWSPQLCTAALAHPQTACAARRWEHTWCFTPSSTDSMLHCISTTWNRSQDTLWLPAAALLGCLGRGGNRGPISVTLRVSTSAGSGVGVFTDGGAIGDFTTTCWGCWGRGIPKAVSG